MPSIATYVIQVTISPWSKLSNMVVQMTVVCSITLKWKSHLKMDPCHYPNQNIFQDVAYLNSRFTWWWNLCTWALVTESLSGKNIKEEDSIFNYCLSRARRVIENCLGILVARWRIFCRGIQAKVESVQAIVQAAICSHNYLRQTDTASYCLAGFVDKFDDSGNILQESGAESLQLMKVPVLFATYLLREEPDNTIMLWMAGRLWKPMLTQTTVLFPGNGITFVNEVPSVTSRFTEDMSDLYPHRNLLLAFIVCDKPFSS